MKYDRHRILLAALVAAFLSGCNSTEQALQPLPGDVARTENGGAAAIASQGSASTDLSAASNSTAGAPSVSASQPAAGAENSLRFTPVIGAPLGAVTPLSRQLAAEAKNRGIAIRGSSDTGGDYILKGYFSAENDGSKTTIFFVWDIIDPAGNRVHRIQGREEVPGAAQDAWAAVPASAMERVATRTFDEYQAWLAARRS